MANTPSLILTTSNESLDIVSPVTRYFPIGGTLIRLPDAFTTTEAPTQYTTRVAGVFSKLYVRVSTNAKTGTTPTIIRTRKNLANGNQSVSIGSGVTGVFEDTTNSDTVTATDEFNYQVVYSGTDGLQLINIVSISFLPASNTATYLMSFLTSAVNITTTTRYQGISGLYESVNTVEQNAKARIQTACTLRNLYVYVSANTSGTITVRLRKNGVNGNSVINSTTTTGIFEDTTNTDSIAAGDDVNFSVVGSSATGTKNILLIGMSMLTTNNDFFLGGVDANNTEGIINFGVTNYIPISGRPFHTTTEANTKVKVRLTKLELSKLTVQITANSINGTSTVRTRKSGANGSQSVSIGASATGFFTDSTNSDSGLISTNDINYQIITGGTGGNLTIRYVSTIADSSVSSVFNYSPSEPAILLSQTLSRLKKAVRNISDSVTIAADSITRSKKMTKSITEPSIVSFDSISRLIKVNKSLSDNVPVSADSISNIRNYFRNINNEPSISAGTSNIIRKVTRQISEPAITCLDTITRKISRSKSEPAVSVLPATISRKVSRPTRVEPAINILDIIQKKATKGISEPPILSLDSLSIKITRQITEPPITNISDTVSQNKKKAIRALLETPINVSDFKPSKKVSHFITDNPVLVSDITDAHKRTSFNLSEPAITVSSSLTRTKKAFRDMQDTITILSDKIQKKATKNLSETPPITVNSIISKKVTHFITTATVPVSDIISSRQKKAVRFMSDTIVPIIDSISKSAIKSRSIVNEPPVSNISDTVVSTKRIVRNIVEPSLSTSDIITRQAFFKRTVLETPIKISDILAKTKLSGTEKRTFKLGQKFKIKKTENTRLSYTDARGEFSDDSEKFD